MVNRVSTIFEFDDKGGGLKQIRRDIQEADGAAGKLKTSLKGAATELRSNSVAQAAVIGGIAAGANHAIDAASRLQESVNAVNVTFGESAAEVLKLSENAATGVGLAASEFNGLAVSFAGFADKVAGPGADVASIIDDLTTRSADFASTMNIEVTDAATKFRGALAGESEAMRQYGIDISAAAVELFALENGLVESKSEMTEAIKVQARYGLLMQETDKWAGDFAATSDSLANSQRTFSAEMENLSAELGENLAPALATVVTGLSGMLDLMDKLKVTDALSLGWVETAGTGAGRFIRRAFDFGAADANREMVAQFNAAEAAAASFDMTLLDGAGSMAEVRDRVLELTDSHHAANLVALDWNATWGDLTDHSNQYTSGVASADKAMLGLSDTMGGGLDTTQRMTIAVQSADTAMINYARDTNSMVDAQEAAAAAAEAHEQALADLLAEVDRNLSTMFDYENSLHDLVNSTQDYEQRERDLNTQLGNNEITLEEYATELRNLRVDQNNLADDALSAAEMFAEQQGAVAGTTESYKLQKEELLRLADQFPLLRDEIAQYIEQLNRIPSVIGTQITIGYSGGGSQVVRTSGSSQSVGNVSTTGMQALDDGGIVRGPKGSPQLVLAHGGETVLPTHKMKLPSMMAGGVSIGQIVVEAPYGAGPEEFGRRVVAVLNRHVRFNGPPIRNRW